MGSGTGKSRRARTSAPPTVPAAFPLAGNQEVAFQRDKWLEFIKAGNLRNVKLHNYYLGMGSPSRFVIDSDYRRILRELLADAVTVGAIVLPSLHNTEDF